MKNRVDDSVIQRYLNEEMTEAERLDFTDRLQQSATLRERVETYRLIVEGIRYQGEQEAWRKIKQLEAEAANVESENTSSVTKWLFQGVAASLLLLMVAGSFYWQQDEQRLPRLATKYFKPYEARRGPSRGAGQDTLVLPEAIEAYYVKQYDRAIELFTQASEQEDRPYIWLYLGNAYFSNDQPDKAVVALEHVLTYPDVDERTRLRTHWDLGLAYLKLANKKAAIHHLESIQDTEDYGAKAKNIIKSIY